LFSRFFFILLVYFGFFFFFSLSFLFPSPMVLRVVESCFCFWVLSSCTVAVSHSELKRTLSSYGVSFAVFEVNQTHSASQIKSVLKTKTGYSTFPNLFIKGESKGGCIDVKELEATGQLTVLLAPYVGPHRNPGPEITYMGLLWFPETVNGHVARLTALFTVVYCVLCVGFYHSEGARWAVFALALDFLVRLMYGSQYSILGGVSAALLVNVTPKWSTGPPKVSYYLPFLLHLSDLCSSFSISSLSSPLSLLPHLF
jgi:glutaredoxin